MKKAIKDFIKYIERQGFEFYGSDEDLVDEECESLEFLYDAGEIKINIDMEKQEYDMFFDLPYYDIETEFYKKRFLELDGGNEYSEEDNLFADIRGYWIRKHLQYLTWKYPDIGSDNHYMCPGSSTYVGYFCLPLTNKKYISYIFEAQKKVDESIATKDIKAEIKAVMLDLLPNKYVFCGKQIQSRDKRCIVFVDFESVNIKLRFNERANEVYLGSENVLLRFGNKVVALGKNDTAYFDELCEALLWGDVEYYKNDDSNVLVTNGLFYLLVKERACVDSVLSIETLYLKDQARRFRNFEPSAKIVDVDFSILDADAFTKLCYDYLLKAGFENVIINGKTNAPDGGVDIYANDVVKGNLGTEIRKIIVQCKHSKTSIGRKDVSEIQDLLREHKAEKYLLFCSSDLTPDAISRLKGQNDDRANSVIAYSRIEFVAELNKYPELIIKYRLERFI